MTAIGKNYWRALTVAVTGLALISVGLWLALRSNPAGFSIAASDDGSIYGLAAGGLLTALVGVALLLVAAKQTASSMPPEQRRKTNTAIGIGLLFQAAALTLAGVRPTEIALVCVLIVASLPLFVLGATYYAQGKGYSKQLGLLGAVGVPGMIILLLLPDQRESEP